MNAHQRRKQRRRGQRYLGDMKERMRSKLANKPGFDSNGRLRLQHAGDCLAWLYQPTT